jgi:hypothetical protein
MYVQGSMSDIEVGEVDRRMREVELFGLRQKYRRHEE